MTKPPAPGGNMVGDFVKWLAFSFFCLVSAFAVWPVYVIRNFPRLMVSSTYFPLGIILILIDQVLKIWSVFNLKEQDAIVFIQGIFEFKYVENTGAAFGILKGKTFLFILMAALTIMIILVYLAMVDEEEPVVRIALVLILAGALGNLIDRLVLGYVIDYIHVFWAAKGWEWPVFNFADMIIDIGVVIIVLDFLYDLFFERETGEATAA